MDLFYRCIKDVLKNTIKNIFGFFWEKKVHWQFNYKHAKKMWFILGQWIIVAKVPIKVYIAMFE